MNIIGGFIWYPDAVASGPRSRWRGVNWLIEDDVFIHELNINAKRGMIRLCGGNGFIVYRHDSWDNYEIIANDNPYALTNTQAKPIITNALAYFKTTILPIKTIKLDEELRRLLTDAPAEIIADYVEEYHLYSVAELLRNNRRPTIKFDREISTLLYHTQSERFTLLETLLEINPAFFDIRESHLPHSPQHCAIDYLKT